MRFKCLDCETEYTCELCSSKAKCPKCEGTRKLTVEGYQAVRSYERQIARKRTRGVRVNRGR